MKEKKDRIREIKLGLILSIIAVIFSSINVIICSIYARLNGATITIFCSNVLIMCLILYRYEKVKIQFRK